MNFWITIFDRVFIYVPNCPTDKTARNEEWHILILTYTMFTTIYITFHSLTQDRSMLLFLILQIRKTWVIRSTGFICVKMSLTYHTAQLKNPVASLLSRNKWASVDPNTTWIEGSGEERMSDLWICRWEKNYLNGFAVITRLYYTQFHAAGHITTTRSPQIHFTQPHTYTHRTLCISCGEWNFRWYEGHTISIQHHHHHHHRRFRHHYHRVFTWRNAGDSVPGAICMIMCIVVVVDDAQTGCQVTLVTFRRESQSAPLARSEANRRLANFLIRFPSCG